MILIIIVFTILISLLIIRRREKKVSISVMSTNEEQAYELFFKRLSNEMPRDYIKVIKNPTNTEFQFTLKNKQLK